MSRVRAGAVDALERFLARLADSPHASQFVLKGAMLLAALSARRPTADIDLMARHLSNDEQVVLNLIAEIAALPGRTGTGVMRTLVILRGFCSAGNRGR